MSRRIMLIIMVMGWFIVGGVVAQDFRTFQPREAFITFDYPVTWQVREQGQIIALYSDESVLPLPLDTPLNSGQFKILLTYLTAEQRAQANIRSTDADSILAEVVAGADVEIPTQTVKRYEFNRRLTVRSDFVNEGNEGAIWIMEMPDNATVMMQAVTAPDERVNIEGAMIELLRSLNLSAIRQTIFDIPNLDRPLQFTPEQSRLVFTYPEGWEVAERNATTVTLSAPQTQISLQFYDYTDLSLQGIPIDDPTSSLLVLQNRSERPNVFAPIGEVAVNGQTIPYSDIIGENFSGISLGRDIKVGFLWVTLLTGDDAAFDEYQTLAWALLLSTTYRADDVLVTERVIMPQHQFGFFYPADWLIREVSPSSYMLGTSPEMIDRTPDSLQFTDDAQLLVQYVTADEYTVARSNTTTTIEVLQKFTQSASDLTTYDTPRTVTLGVFEFAQVDFDHPNYSGTALLAPMADGGALWMQLRTPPGELGDWEPVALAVARNARIFTLGDPENSTLGDAVFDALNIEPTPIPTPTRRPDAPADLGDVIGDVVATPVPISVRELNFELPLLESTYTTNFSQMTSGYPAGWLVQENFPASDSSPLFENTITMSNNANMLLTNSLDIKEGDAEMVVQYARYDELQQLGLQGESLLAVVQAITSRFPQGTFDAPILFRINGDLMVVVTSSTATHQSISLHKEVADGSGYIKVELLIHPGELESWLATAVAVVQSVQVP